MGKLKVALYWASSCGGCDIATLAIGEKILDVAAAADIVFWPVAMDFKYKDVEQMADQSIDACLFNGAIRSTEDEHVAKMLRAKSKIMIAYGSCAYEGCIPGLANLFSMDSVFDRVYTSTPSTNNEQKVYPQANVQVPEGELELPRLFSSVRALNQIIDVDYFVPGCPPEPKTTWLALEALVSGNLPEKGSIISHSSKALCDECPLPKEGKKVKKFFRPHQIIADPTRCLLDQGLLCYGVATRGGCGAMCPQAGMPCTGCYGPVEGVVDQGLHFLTALGSLIDSTDTEEIAQIIDEIADPAGTFYRYSLPVSLLRRAKTI
ncbi:MAG: oxidoreductase [Proteobacteria bacterium]|nr:oxidoreductase [Pseudomonadota bacterium]